MHLSLTITLILITAVTSFIAFSNQKVINDLIFYPPAVTYHNQWYRFISCGFIHADIGHLAFNMLSFYFFGPALEKIFERYFEGPGKLLYLIFYASSLVVCLLPTYIKNRYNSDYRSLGASGAVSAVIFATIYYSPLSKVGIMFLPEMPGFIFGPLYLIITAVLIKRGQGNINHSAHFWGAIYGIAFFTVACLALSDFNPLTNFVEQVKSYFH